jgi:hypothetical protein
MTTEAGSFPVDPVGTADRLRSDDGGPTGSPSAHGRPGRKPLTDEERQARAERVKNAWASGKYADRRPKGSKGSSDTPRKAPPEPVRLTEEEARMIGNLCGALWALAGKFVGLAPLDDAEKFELGSVAAPVLNKYLPALGQYAPEAALVITVAALVERTRIKKTPNAPAPEAPGFEVMEDALATP